MIKLYQRGGINALLIEGICKSKVSESGGMNAYFTVLIVTKLEGNGNMVSKAEFCSQ